MEVLIAMLLSLLALDLLLSVMADPTKAIHAFLANEFFPGVFAVGIRNFLEIIERRLAATSSDNLPMTDSDFMIAKVAVFEAADVVAGHNVSSQCAYLCKQSGPFLIDSYSAAIFVAHPNPSYFI